MRTYKDKPLGAVILCSVVICVIVCLSAPYAAGWITGRTMLKSNRLGPGTHVMTNFEFGSLLVFAGIWILVTLLFMLNVINSKVETDINGIRRYGMSGSVEFSARWAELTAVTCRLVTKRGDAFVYVVRAGDRSMEFSPSMDDLGILRGEIRQKASHLDFTDWD